MGNSCSAEISCDDVFTFEADPDIAGIGVITSFFIAAWFSYCTALYTYVFVDGMIDPNSPIAARLDTKLREVIQNAEAKVTTSRFHDWLREKWPFKNRGVTKKQMQDVCLMFADLQLVTGASILLTGYSRHCIITQYHFYVVSLLGIVSFVTFQTMLLVVHDRLQGKLQKGWRLIWVFAIFGGVLAANFVIYNYNFLGLGGFGRSMHCLWQGLPGVFTPPLLPYVIVGTILDVWTLYTIVLYLYPSLGQIHPFVEVNWICKWVAQVPTRLYLATLGKEKTTGTRCFLIIGQWLTWFPFLISFTLRELVVSRYIDLARAFLILLQATSSVKWARDQAALNGREDDEDTWGFGQILPLLLLSLLLLQFVEILWGNQAIENDDASGHRFPATEAPSEIQGAQILIEDDPIEDFEESMYKKPWFMRWIVIVVLLLYAGIIGLSVTLTEGVPI